MRCVNTKAKTATLIFIYSKKSSDSQGAYGIVEHVMFVAYLVVVR